MRKLLTYFLTLLVCFSFPLLEASAHEDHSNLQKSSLAMNVAFDAQGKLWRVVEKNGLIWVDASHDLGQIFSKPVQINPTTQKIVPDGEARPKIALGPEGNIYLTWTEALKKPFSGSIWFSRSIDAGKTFETPIIVHQDRAEITHRFDSLDVSQYGDAKGNITVTWVDKRDLIAAKAAKKSDAKKTDEGAAIYYAISTDKGVSFAPEQKLADSSCECCRIALTNKPDGTAVAMWCHVFEGGERDHMMAEIPAQASQAPVLKRATFGRWKIDGCPHHGAALARGGEGKDWWGYHMAWFDGGNDESGKDAGLFYARMDGEAWVSSPPKKFGNHKNQADHPALLSMGDKVWLVWRESEAKHNSIVGMFSDDGGRSWGDAKALATSSGKVDYSQLLSSNNQVYLVWNTEKENLQVIPL
ncbi:MAG: exo-alpha-sialidase [Methylotenera sp.]|nr:exo-alpha-sialidase [Methylotenera sp.]